MKTRIYIVTPLPGGLQIGLPALVDAASAAQATAHVAGRLLTVLPATGHQIAALMGPGHKVERAGKAPANPTASPYDADGYLHSAPPPLWETGDGDI